jgi:2'-5' RNA ligase
VARLFVAVRPPAEVLDLVEALPRVEEPGVRYAARDQWHVTLRFFGEADEEDAAQALTTVDASRCEATIGPQVSRLGRSIIVVPVSGLDELATDVIEATAAVGEPPEPRPFAGHLTIARLKNRGSCRIAGAPIAASFTVEEIELMRSHRHPRGAHYETVARRSLGR